MNEYNRIKEYLYNEPRMKPFLNEAKEECCRNNCQSYVVIIQIAIEKLLDSYEDKCDELIFLESRNNTTNKDKSIKIHDLGLYKETEIEHLDVSPRKTIKKKVKIKTNNL